MELELGDAGESGCLRWGRAEPVPGSPEAAFCQDPLNKPVRCSATVKLTKPTSWTTTAPSVSDCTPVNRMFLMNTCGGNE